MLEEAITKQSKIKEDAHVAAFAQIELATIYLQNSNVCIIVFEF